MLVLFLILVFGYPPKPLIRLSSSPECYRLAWLNLLSAEVGHGFCREEESTLDHLVSITRASTMAVYWIEKVDCQTVRGGNGCEWENKYGTDQNESRTTTVSGSK